MYYLQPLFTDPDKNRDLIYHEADERAAWIMDTGLGFFDIATFCLVDMPRERSPMDQVYNCCVFLNTRVTYFTFEGQRPNIQTKR